MKVIPELYPTDFDAAPGNEIQLPQGLIGFTHYKRAELLYLPDHLPFLWMKLQSNVDDLHFIVIEPGGIVPGYEPEIFDHDELQPWDELEALRRKSQAPCDRHESGGCSCGKGSKRKN